MIDGVRNREYKTHRFMDSVKATFSILHSPFLTSSNIAYMSAKDLMYAILRQTVHKEEPGARDTEPLDPAYQRN